MKIVISISARCKWECFFLAWPAVIDWRRASSCQIRCVPVSMCLSSEWRPLVRSHRSAYAVQPTDRQSQRKRVRESHNWKALFGGIIYHCLLLYICTRIQRHTVRPMQHTLQSVQLNADASQCWHCSLLHCSLGVRAEQLAHSLIHLPQHAAASGQHQNPPSFESQFNRSSHHDTSNGHRSDDGLLQRQFAIHQT